MKLAFLLVALGCGCLSGASFAATTPVPRTGLLGFTCGGCPGAETTTSLFTIGVDGRHLQLVANGVGAYDPRWSPDGRTIAVSRHFAEIWVSGAQGRSWRRLTKPLGEGQGAGDRSPSWFPDGKRIVFVRATPPPPGAGGSNRTALWSVGIPEPRAKRLFVPPASEGSADATNVNSAEPSHDGRRIAFADVSERLWVANADGTRRRRLGPASLTGRGPRWAPDDRRVAFYDAEAGALRILDLPTNRVRTIIDGEATDSYSWSPDGRWLALARSREYECGDPTGPCYDLEFWIVNPTDGRQRRIFRTDYGEIYGLDWRNAGA